MQRPPSRYIYLLCDQLLVECVLRVLGDEGAAVDAIYLSIHINIFIDRQIYRWIDLIDLNRQIDRRRPPSRCIYLLGDELLVECVVRVVWDEGSAVDKQIYIYIQKYIHIYIQIQRDRQIQIDRQIDSHFRPYTSSVRSFWSVPRARCRAQRSRSRCYLSIYPYRYIHRQKDIQIDRFNRSRQIDRSKKTSLQIYIPPR